MKEECKVSCVNIITCSIVVKECTNTQVFYIFEYGTDYGGECSGKCGAK